MYERVPNKPEAEKAALNNLSSPSLKRRNFEEMNGMDGKLLMNLVSIMVQLIIADVAV